MQLRLQNFSTLVQNMSASLQSSAQALLDLTAGSVLRALLEANASAALWLQWMAVQILTATRAATSSGPDLDSWVADFGVSRLPGQAATATVTFARATPGYAATIPVGTQVKTGDASVTFAVIADPTNAAFNAGAGTFSLPAATLSLNLAVQATAQGAVGNVTGGAISLLATAIPGIDSVTNAAPAAGGLDAEPDAALRLRFGNFMDSRSRATPAAIAFAIQSLQQGLTYVLAENTDPSGAARPGFFTITLNDGSGAPPATTIANVSAALEAVRPVGTQFAVQPPVVQTANIALTITAPASAAAAIQAAVAAAITSFVSACPIGGPLPISRLAALAFGADPRVSNVSNVTINGAAQDLTPPANGQVMLGTLTVS